MDSNVNISGIIYIDLNMVILKICQVKGEKISIVEYLEYPLNLGNDTFSTGKISFNKVSELISTLNNYISVLKDYHIKRYTIIATADLKEAVNKEYIFDQIILKTGHRVNILEDSIEKAYIYKEIYRQYRNHPDYSQSKSLIVYIGTGSVKVLYHEESLIRFTRDIQIGSIKLSEILSDIQDHTNNFHIVLKEYLNSFIDILNQLIPTKSIQTFIATGRLFKVVARMCNIHEKNNTFIIHSDDLKQLFNKIKDLSPKQLQDEYHLSNYQAEVILPALIIYIKLLNLTHVESIISPIITVYDSILREMLFSNEIPEMEQEIKKNTIASAKSLAEVYKYDQEHSEVVENFSLIFFDKLKNIHGMDDRDRLLLQIAAILHDIGKFISIKKHYVHSHYIIKNSDILGLTNYERSLIAIIALFHSTMVPNSESEYYRDLLPSERVRVSKLIAILRLADSLHSSHIKKFDKVSVKIKGKQIIITVYTIENTIYEEWTFNNKRSFFEDVFGLRPIFKKKLVNLYE